MGMCFAALLVSATMACATPDYQVYTLYRGSLAPDMDRVHVATFDATFGASYNKENCEIAETLFETQPGVVIQYWCEQGRAAR